jgi:isoleucyl-tRNA synthetase
MADFVAPDAGTGCVHIAPGHGEEDYLVGLKYDLPVVMPVGPNGRYAEGKYGPSEKYPDGLWIYQDDSNESMAAVADGTYKKCSYQTNEVIFADLKQMGVLVATEDVVHNYPYCARSDTPVIFRATEQWFLICPKCVRVFLRL